MAPAYASKVDGIWPQELESSSEVLSGKWIVGPSTALCVLLRDIHRCKYTFKSFHLSIC